MLPPSVIGQDEQEGFVGRLVDTLLLHNYVDYVACGLCEGED